MCVCVQALAPVLCLPCSVYIIISTCVSGCVCHLYVARGPPALQTCLKGPHRLSSHTGADVHSPQAKSTGPGRLFGETTLPSPPPPPPPHTSLPEGKLGWGVGVGGYGSCPLSYTVKSPRGRVISQNMLLWRFSGTIQAVALWHVTYLDSRFMLCDASFKL